VLDGPGELIREFRILADQRGDLRSLCKIALSQSDGSLYLFPYAAGGSFHFGRSSIPADEGQATIPFDDQETSPRTPKLSIHETGQVHIQAGERRVRPMSIPPLSDLRGQHVASVTCVRFSALAHFDRAPRLGGAERDLIIPVGEGVESGRLALYVNGEAPAFPGKDAITFALRRPTLERPLYLRLTPYSQPPLGEEGGATVIMAAGWNPQGTPVSEPVDYLFIVTR
jgi:hypothetical protein